MSGLKGEEGSRADETVRASFQGIHRVDKGKEKKRCVPIRFALLCFAFVEKKTKKREINDYCVLFLHTTMVEDEVTDLQQSYRLLKKIGCSSGTRSERMLASRERRPRLDQGR